MNRNNQDIIIAKALANEANDAELTELANWRKESIENETEYQQTKTIWEQSENDTQDIDTDAAWQQTKLRIEAAEKTKPKLLYTMMRYAAAILFFGTAAYLGYTTFINPMVYIETADNEIKEVLLPDGSKVWVNENSQLSYHKKLNGATRRVHLTGEAFFDIEKNPERPFIIEADQAITEVLGTSFNLTVKNGEKEALLSVLTGKVRFKSSLKNEEVIVIAGNKASINNDGNAQLIGKIDVNEAAWKNRKLVFNNTSLKDAFVTLEKYFKVEIKVENEAILNCHFTGEFIDPKLSDVLDILGKTLQLTYSKDGKKVTIKGRGC